MHRKIYGKEGEELVHIEYFHDYDPDRPDAFARFRVHMTKLPETYGKYNSYVIESVTSMALSSRYYHKRVLNPDTKEPRQWHAGATDDLEEFLCLRFPSLPYNVGVSLHTSREKDEVSETFVRNLSAPGRLSARHMLAGYWPEVYRAYAREQVIEKVSPDRKLYYFLQTQIGRIEGEKWFAATQIHPPALCWNNYNSLWQEGQVRKPLHVLVYGDTGAGKTTFLSTLPQPIYLMQFDGLGKETPFLRLGEDGGLKN